MADGMNPQERDAWVAKRVGKITASRMSDVVLRKKDGNPYSTYGDYQAEIILERLTGRATDHFVSKPMEIGIEREPEAAFAYAMETGQDLDFSDFVDHPKIAMSGASPDRLVGSDGLLEIKCPQPKAHLDFLMIGVAPDNYYWQCQWQMACTGRAWCDLYYYNPDFPAHLQARAVRIERDAAHVEEAEEKVAEFHAKIERRIELLNEAGLPF